MPNGALRVKCLEERNRKETGSSSQRPLGIDPERLFGVLAISTAIARAFRPSLAPRVRTAMGPIPIEGAVVSRRWNFGKGNQFERWLVDTHEDSDRFLNSLLMRVN
jgi:hypothetical protein